MTTRAYEHHTTSTPAERLLRAQLDVLVRIDCHLLGCKAKRLGIATVIERQVGTMAPSSGIHRIALFDFESLVDPRDQVGDLIWQ